MDLRDFRASRVPMTKTQYNSIYGDDIVIDADKVFVYVDGLFIEVRGENCFSLLLERSNYENNRLELLEELLWDDFAKYELDVSDEEIEEDLHSRAKDILDRLGLDCSLDEVDMGSVLCKKTKRDIEYLLPKFQEYLIPERYLQMSFDIKVNAGVEEFECEALYEQLSNVIDNFYGMDGQRVLFSVGQCNVEDITEQYEQYIDLRNFKVNQD